MRVVKAAAVQLSPVLYSREGTVEKVVRKIHELDQQGLQFATFPETVVPYYPYFSFVQSPYQIIAGREHLKLLDQAVTVPSPATDAISEACKRAGVVVSIGVNERDGGTLYNTQLLFNADGTLIQQHVFDYKRDDIAAEIAKLTSGRGVDLVFDATYSEQGIGCSRSRGAGKSISIRWRTYDD